jgi:biotin carboxyl carrier protein
MVIAGKGGVVAVATLFRLSDGRREWLATVDGSAVTIDGVDGEFVVTPRPDGRWSIAHAGQMWTSVAVPAPDGIWTGLDGSVKQWQAERASSRTRHKVVDDSIRAPMSATVIRVHVAVGSVVVEGDPLIVVEAMKMEMPLRAPRAGIVGAVHCKEGELVQPTTVLVELA